MSSKSFQGRVSSRNCMFCHISHADSDKVATFDMKLMDIDAEHLAIPVSINLCAVNEIKITTCS